MHPKGAPSRRPIPRGRAQLVLDTSARMNRIVYDQSVLRAHPPATLLVQTLVSAQVQNATVPFLLPSYIECTGLNASARPPLCSSLAPGGLVPSDGEFSSHAVLRLVLGSVDLSSDVAALQHAARSVCPGRFADDGSSVRDPGPVCQSSLQQRRLAHRGVLGPSVSRGIMIEHLQYDHHLSHRVQGSSCSICSNFRAMGTHRFRCAAKQQR